jgi:hypothetical protein
MYRTFRTIVHLRYIYIASWTTSSYYESLPTSSRRFGTYTHTYGHRYPSPPKPTFPPPNSSYITPPTSPDTPSPSYSTSTSPASTASPPTPPGMEGCTACIVSASSSPGVPKHEPVPVPRHLKDHPSSYHESLSTSSVYCCAVHFPIARKPNLLVVVYTRFPSHLCKSLILLIFVNQLNFLSLAFHA